MLLPHVHARITVVCQITTLLALLAVARPAAAAPRRKNAAAARRQPLQKPLAGEKSGRHTGEVRTALGEAWMGSTDRREEIFLRQRELLPPPEAASSGR